VQGELAPPASPSLCASIVPPCLEDPDLAHEVKRLGGEGADFAGQKFGVRAPKSKTRKIRALTPA